MPSKFCKKCGETKPLDAFSRDNRSKGHGRQTMCRACNAIYRRAHYEANRERLIAKSRAYRKANPEKRQAALRAWHEANREQQRAYQSEIRAKQAGLPCEEVDYGFVLYRDAGICGICEHPVDPEDWHVDHIVPISKGGPHTYANVQVAHPDCNRRKGVSLSHA